jgi:DNA-binding beta-propeller fold protein YncE
MRALGAALALVALAAAMPGPAGAQAPHFVQQWGTQGSAVGQFSVPFGIAWSPSGRLYVCDQGNARVQYFTSSGDHLGSFAHTDSYNIAVGPDGSVYLSSGLRVRRVSADGVFIREWGGEQTPCGEFFGAVALAVEPDGHVLVLAVDSKRRRICRFTPDGQFLGKIEGGEMSEAPGSSIAVNDQGEVYVSGPHDAMAPGGATYTVLKFSAAGELIATITPPFPSNVPTGLAVDKQGNLYFVDPGLDHVLMFSPSGELIANWGTSGSAPGQFDTPVGVALDGAGRVFISDLANHRIQVFGDETAATPSTWGRVKAEYRE